MGLTLRGHAGCSTTFAHAAVAPTPRVADFVVVRLHSRLFLRSPAMIQQQPDTRYALFYRTLALRCIFAAVGVVALLACLRFLRILPPGVANALAFASMLLLYALWCAGFIGALASLIAGEAHPLRSVLLLLLYVLAALIAVLPAFRPVSTHTKPELGLHLKCAQA